MIAHLLCNRSTPISSDLTLTTFVSTMSSVKSFRDVGVATAVGETAKVTAAASTLPELISTIPRAYQAVLGDHLTRKFRAAQKHANVQTTVSLYDRHEKDGSFPPLIRNALKEPKLQFAKEYKGTTEGSGAEDVFKAAVFSARKAVLTSSLELKQKELAHLAGLIVPEPEAWQKVVRETAAKVAAQNGGKLIEDKDGRPVMADCPPAAQIEFGVAWSSCQIYTYRVLALARAAIDRAELQKFAKMQLKETTDVEMTDAPTKDQSVKDVVTEALKAFKKELLQANGKLQKSANRVQKQKSPVKKAKNGGGNQKKKGKKSR